MDIPPVVLPPWQAEALARLVAAWERGERVLVTMPLQSGKRAMHAALGAKRGR